MIIKGNTVGTPMPRANWAQCDPAKADYIRGKETVEQAIAAAKSCAEEAKTAAAEAKTAAGNHADARENPHGVTPSQIGAQVQHWNAAITLPAANWAGGSQSVALPEMGRDDTVISTPAPESCDLYAQSCVRLSAQSAGMLTYTCENAPREDLRVYLTCFGAAGSAGTGGGSGGGSGKDGISPVAQVTQTATGAEISITDATGTTKATIRNGKDYILTSADKNEIAELAAGMVDVPAQEKIDLSDYAKKDEIPAKVSQLENDAKYLTQHQDISGKLDRTELPDAIDDALAQAKASGAFDGKDGNDGISATHSWNGTTLTVTSASGTSSANLKGEKGDKGDAYTLTASDKATIVSAVIAALPVYAGEVV